MKNGRRPATFQVVTTGAALAQVLAGDVERTGLVLAALTNNVFITSEPGAAAGVGLPILTAAQPLTLCRCHSGDWVSQRLFAASPAGAASLVIIEGFQPWDSESENQHG